MPSSFQAGQNLTAPVSNGINSPPVQIFNGDQALAMIFSKELSSQEVVGLTAMLLGYAHSLPPAL